ncbi:hypothetical protein DMUE_2996 [Dictyocoela muelleri]|nr:hypothetical protein DMUE_2996 [Dictyocoela muelleri]
MICNRFIYNLDKRFSNFLSWRCVTGSYKGRVKTNLDASEIFKKIQHWHEKENSKIMRLEMDIKLKIMAEKNKDTFNFSINECLSGVSENERQYLGNYSNIRDYFTKMRNKFANPNLKSDSDIIETSRYTIDNDLFIQHDSGRDDSKRFLIFTTNLNLELFSKSEV